MDRIIKFETHKGLFEQSWGRCLKRGLTPNKKLVALNNVKIVEDSKRYSLIKAFRKSIKDLRDINDFRNFIFLLTDKEGVILELDLPHADIDFYLKKGMVLKEEIAGTNAVSLAIREENIVVVRKEQHYIEDLKRLNCTAGPIFDKEGNCNIKYHKRKIFKLLGTRNVKDCIYKATKLDLI